METVPNEVKHTIRDLRVRANMTLKDACGELKITIPTLQKWEKDSSVLPLKKVQRLAALYEIPLEYIFIGPNDAFAKNKKQNWLKNSDKAVDGRQKGAEK